MHSADKAASLRRALIQTEASGRQHRIQSVATFRNQLAAILVPSSCSFERPADNEMMCVSPMQAR